MQLTLLVRSDFWGRDGDIMILKPLWGRDGDIYFNLLWLAFTYFAK